MARARFTHPHNPHPAGETLRTPTLQSRAPLLSHPRPSCGSHNGCALYVRRGGGRRHGVAAGAAPAPTAAVSGRGPRRRWASAPLTSLTKMVGRSAVAPLAGTSVAPTPHTIGDRPSVASPVAADDARSARRPCRHPTQRWPTARGGGGRAEPACAGARVGAGRGRRRHRRRGRRHDAGATRAAGGGRGATRSSGAAAAHPGCIRSLFSAPVSHSAAAPNFRASTIIARPSNAVTGDTYMPPTLRLPRLLSRRLAPLSTP